MLDRVVLLARFPLTLNRRPSLGFLFFHSLQRTPMILSLQALAPTLPPDMTCSVHPANPAGDAGVLVPWASEGLCTCLASLRLFSSVLALCIMTSWFHTVSLMALCLYLQPLVQ